MKVTDTRRLRGALLLAGTALVLQPGTAPAATFPAACTGATGDVASLVAAIESANANGAGADVVALGSGCTYTLTTPHNNWYGPNGLPPIASDVTIAGNGATITAPQGRRSSASSSSAQIARRPATSRPAPAGSPCWT